MNAHDIEVYKAIGDGKPAYFQQKRGLIAVWGTEAERFLNGLITNDVAKLEDGAEMLAAFPNAQGRLLAVVRVKRSGEEFLFETDGATHDKVYQNLFRFTFAGDFFAEDRTASSLVVVNAEVASGITFAGEIGSIVHSSDDVSASLEGAFEISPELYEVLRIERGVPVYGVDMDETTIVPELGIDGLISYNKGCYIGQEIIARIYFRGHVAKQMRGLIFDGDSTEVADLTTDDGKSAGRITSKIFSPSIGKTIALGLVRYDYLAVGTGLNAGAARAIVAELPFVG